MSEPMPRKKRHLAAADDPASKIVEDAPPPPPAPDLSHIAPDLHGLAVPVDSLKPDPKNARAHNNENLDTIRNSIQRYGQRKPIVYNKRTGFVEAGNGTLLIFKELGLTHIAAVGVDDDDVTAAGFGLADNRTAELAGWREDVLAELLEGQKAAGVDVKQLGWSEADVEAATPSERTQVDKSVPPKLAWVLVGIPIERYGEIAADMERIGGMRGVTFETTVTCER